MLKFHEHKKLVFLNTEAFGLTKDLPNVLYDIRMQYVMPIWQAGKVVPPLDGLKAALTSHFASRFTKKEEQQALSVETHVQWTTTRSPNSMSIRITLSLETRETMKEVKGGLLIRTGKMLDSFLKPVPFWSEWQKVLAFQKDVKPLASWLGVPDAIERRVTRPARNLHSYFDGSFQLLTIDAVATEEELRSVHERGSAAWGLETPLPKIKRRDSVVYQRPMTQKRQPALIKEVLKLRKDRSQLEIERLVVLGSQVRKRL